MGLSNLSFSATNINAGNDADRPPATVGGLYIATDTNKVYVCYVDGEWTVLIAPETVLSNIVALAGSVVSNITVSSLSSTDGTEVFYEDDTTNSFVNSTSNHYTNEVRLKNIPSVNPIKIKYFLQKTGGSSDAYGVLQKNGVDIGSIQSVTPGNSGTKYELVSDVLPTDVFRVRYWTTSATSYATIAGKIGLAGTISTTDLSKCTELV
jgi:hypothetical protein